MLHLFCAKLFFQNPKKSELASTPSSDLTLNSFRQKMKKVVRNEITSKEKKKCWSVIQIIDFSNMRLQLLKIKVEKSLKMTITINPNLIVIALIRNTNCCHRFVRT
jgi:hypothetical protein